MSHSDIFSRFRGLVCLSFAALISFTSVIALADETTQVQVEEVEITPSSTEKDASTLWKETKKKTGEAASTAAEFSKVQGTKILEAGKTGVAKGASAVSEGSSKAWDATKKATKSAAEYTGEKAAKAGAVIADVVKGEDSKAPVTDKSISE